MTAGFQELVAVALVTPMRRWRNWNIRFVALVAVLWAVLISFHFGLHHPASNAHEHHHVSEVPSLSGLFVGWGSMVAAMMLPLTLPQLQYVALNSYPWRRWRACLVFLLCYFGCWLGVGIVALVALQYVHSLGFLRGDLLIVGLLVATVVQLSRFKRRALIACGRTIPIRPEGWRADVSCARYGFRSVRSCICTCGVLMVLMLTITSAWLGLVWMVAVSMLIAFERYHPNRGLQMQRLSALVLGLVLVVLVVGRL